jgi:hypothetical protein
MNSFPTHTHTHKHTRTRTHTHAQAHINTHTSTHTCQHSLSSARASQSSIYFTKLIRLFSRQIQYRTDKSIGLGHQTLPCGHQLHEKCINEMRRPGSSGRCTPTGQAHQAIYITYIPPSNIYVCIYMCICLCLYTCIRTKKYTIQVVLVIL